MPGYRLDSLKSTMDTAQSATASVGAGGNGVVTVTAAAGAVPNTYSLVVVNGTGVDSALAAAFVSPTLTVTLGTDAEEAPDDTKNTATLVAGVIDALANFTAVASGTGATVVPEDSDSFTGGRDRMSVTELARRSTCTVEYIQRLIDGGNCLRHEADQIAAALGTNLAGVGAAAL
jgi:hypothetical protein